MLTIGLLALCALALPSSAAAQSPDRNGVADQFTSRLTLLVDGSLDIEETLDFRFGSRAASTLERRISLARLDDVFDVHATMDGKAMEEGSDAGQIRIERGRRSVLVTWQFPKTANRAHTFTLAYRVMGAMEIALGRASVAWPILPPDRRYRIENARVEWRVPETVTRLIPTSIDSPGWTSGALPDGWMATSEGVDPEATAWLIDEFDEATMAVAIPAWQTNLDLARQLTPAFIVGAGTLLVMGAGIVGMTMFRYHRPRVDHAVIGPAALDSLPPGLATTLAGNRVVAGHAQMRATLLDLANRGLLTVDRAEGRAGAYRIVMPRPDGLRPHEQVVADALWTHLKRDQIDLRLGWRQLQRALPTFRRAVVGELAEAGFVDRDRQSATRGLLIAGVSAVAFGVGGVALFAWLFGELGDLPLVVPGAVLVSGVLLIVTSQVMSVLSLAGATAAAEWSARRQAMAREVQERTEPHEDRRWLSVAVGMGLAAAMKKRGLDLPEWLSQLSSPGH